MDQSLRSEEDLLSFSRSPPSDHGKTVLNLVFQAAELFSGMEEQLRATEARAQSMRKSAAERVQLVEKRIEDERARREFVDQADRNLQNASKALSKNALHDETNPVLVYEWFCTSAQFAELGRINHRVVRTPRILADGSPESGSVVPMACNGLTPRARTGFGRPAAKALLRTDSDGQEGSWVNWRGAKSSALDSGVGREDPVQNCEKLRNLPRRLAHYRGHC